MRKPKRKKPKKAIHKVDWSSILINALMDLLVGTILIIIGKMIE